MSDFYSEPRGASFRPGGWKLTEKAIELCAFPMGAKLCDMGCGEGMTVKKLREIGFDAIGIEPSEKISGECIIRASAESTGFASDTFDGVLFECSLSLCNVPIALSEAGRILKKDGKLIVSDLFSKTGGEKDGGAVKRVFTKEEIVSEIKNAGFDSILFEDCSHDMVTFYLQMIMDGRENEICCDFEYLKSIKAGYFLLIGEKV